MTSVESHSPILCEFGALVACGVINAGTVTRVRRENVQLCNGHSFSTMRVFPTARILFCDWLLCCEAAALAPAR
jgi:hypothetical protein